MSDPNVTSPNETSDDQVEELPQVESPESVYDETPEQTPGQTSEETPARKEVTDEVVSALLQGKYSTDAAEQRRRLEAEGYDADEVKEAVQRRLNQRYE